MTFANNIKIMAESPVEGDGSSPVQGVCFQLAHNYFKNHHREMKTHGIIKAGLKQLWKVIFACFYAKIGVSNNEVLLIKATIIVECYITKDQSQVSDTYYEKGYKSE